MAGELQASIAAPAVTSLLNTDGFFLSLFQSMTRLTDWSVTVYQERFVIKDDVQEVMLVICKYFSILSNLNI